MAKIIISFIGTGGYADGSNKSRGEYRQTLYSIDNRKYETEFIATALMEHHSADKIIYIGTLKAMWDVVYDSYTDNPSSEIWEELSNTIDQANHNTDIKKGDYIKEVFKKSKIAPIIIKYGLNNQEHQFNIQQLFEIENHIQSGDQLYLDITHGFRSLPLILTNVLNFIVDHIKKNISVVDITYGMHEVSNELDGISPIVSLGILKDLNNSIKASHEFIEYGNAYLFSKILSEIKESKSASVLLKDFSNTKSLNHIYNLKQSIIKLKGIQLNNLTPLQSLTIPKTIKSFIDLFKNAKDDSHFQFEIAVWNLKNHSYGYAAIGLSESIVSKVCECLNLDSKDEFSRSLAKKVFNKEKQNKVEKELKKYLKLKGRKDLIDEIPIILKKRASFSGYVNLFKKINKIRIIVAHAIEHPYSVDQLLNNLNSSIEETKEFIYSDKFSY